MTQSIRRSKSGVAAHDFASGINSGVAWTSRTCCIPSQFAEIQGNVDRRAAFLPMG
ncbi:hypothetical protein LJR231_004294 [Phyllobacterium sp. LjRoot231]|uniref:hypothetical protein n=1 Tax=Phyllobacterium sp. LjRoot231 TaxID=3342289 RepID=UPI003ED09361